MSQSVQSLSCVRAVPPPAPERVRSDAETSLRCNASVTVADPDHPSARLLEWMAAGRIGHREVTVHVGLAEEAADCFGSAEPARSRLRVAPATPRPGQCGRHGGSCAYGAWRDSSCVTQPHVLPYWRPGKVLPHPGTGPRGELLCPPATHPVGTTPPGTLQACLVCHRPKA
jgi:hypothetical protein